MKIEYDKIFQLVYIETDDEKEYTKNFTNITDIRNYINENYIEIYTVYLVLDDRKIEILTEENYIF